MFYKSTVGGVFRKRRIWVIASITPVVTGPELLLRRATEQAHFEDELAAARPGPSEPPC